MRHSWLRRGSWSKCTLSLFYKQTNDIQNEEIGVVQTSTGQEIFMLVIANRVVQSSLKMPIKLNVKRKIEQWKSSTRSVVACEAVSRFALSSS